jgi:S-DNA-T family DNA segregation ATPase FtsK/SpoIIIE
MPFRKRQIILSIILGLGAVFLGLSTAASFFELPSIPAFPGNFFAAPYGILSFLIPAVLFWAAVILADPRYRPDKIFLLGFVVIPFMTLALGFALLRDFGFYAASYGFIKTIGPGGLSFCVIFITVLELCVLAFLKSLVFGVPQKAAEPAPESREQTELKVSYRAAYIPILPPSPGSGLADIYAQAAAGRDGAEEDAEVLEVLEVLDAEAPPVQAVLEDKSAIEGKSAEENEKAVKSESDELERVLSEAEEEAQLKTRVKAEQERQLESERERRKRNRGPYQVPVEGILTRYPDGEYWIIDQATKDAARILKETLEEFHIQAEVTGIRKGPVITMFEILPAPGVKLSRIVNLQDNIALRLAASSVRIVAPIPGKHAVGIEVPNQKRNIVSFREIIEGELEGRDGKKPEIPVVLGKDITGEAQTIDLVQTPHLLIAGATGSGKSVCVNSMILSILYQLPPGTAG